MNCCNLVGQDKGVQLSEDPDMLGFGEINTQIENLAISSLRKNGTSTASINVEPDSPIQSRVRSSDPRQKEETAKHINAVIVQLNLFGCVIS